MRERDAQPESRSPSAQTTSPAVRRRVTARTHVATRIAWSSFAASVMLFVAAAVLNLRRPQYPWIHYTTGELVFALGYVMFGWFGALVVTRQPRQPVGWILCALGLIGGLETLASEYAIHGLVTRPGAVPGAAAASWLTTWSFAVLLALVTALLLLFPSGSPPSSRWRWVLWLASISLVLSIMAALPLWPHRGLALLHEHSVPDLTGVHQWIYVVGFYGVVAATLASVAALITRIRGTDRVQRAQIKWVLYAAAASVVGVPGVAVLLAVLGASEAIADATSGMVLLLIPVAVGVAILRYRLFDIDRLISRTLVYGLLTMTSAMVYGVVVLVLGQAMGARAETSSWAVAAATLAVAAVFQPARRRIQTAVDRQFNRRRYDAVKTVEAFTIRMRDELDLTALTTELVAAVGDTMQPTAISLWLRSEALGHVQRRTTTSGSVGADAGRARRRVTST